MDEQREVDLMDYLYFTSTLPYPHPPYLWLTSSSPLAYLYLDLTSTSPQLYLYLTSTLPQLYLYLTSGSPLPYLCLTSSSPRLDLHLTSPQLYLYLTSRWPQPLGWPEPLVKRREIIMPCTVNESVNRTQPLRTFIISAYRDRVKSWR
jgi:hypothetical protein